MGKKTVLALSLVLLSIVGLVAGIYFINKHQQLEAMKEYINHVQSPYERHYLNEHGTITAEISNSPIQYWDENQNTWKPINTNIKEKAQKYVVDEHVFKATFGKKGNEPVSLEQDGYKITYVPVGVNPTAAEVKGNRIAYKGIWKNTDLSYVVNSNGLKMELHLQERQAPKRFSYKMLVEGLAVKLNDDGTITFLDKDGQEKFSVPAMWVKDSSDDAKEMYGRIKVTLKEEKEGEYLLNFTVDDANLVYPLTIDPTTTISGNSMIQDAFGIDNTYKMDTNYNTNELRVQQDDDGSARDDEYIYIKFDMDNIPESSTINNATMSLYLRYIQKSGTPVSPAISIYPFEEAWEETSITYNNSPLVDSANLVTRYNINLSTLKSGTWLSFDVTPHVHDVVNLLKPNNGLYMSLYAETGDDDYLQLSFDSSDGQNSPRLVVDYVPPSDWRGGPESTVTITDAEDSSSVSKQIRWSAGQSYGYDFFYYIRFNNIANHIPQGAKVKKALLYVKKESDYISDSGAPYYFTVSPLLSSWTPGSSTSPTKGKKISVLNSASGSDFYFDVTYDIRRLMRGDPLYGWALHAEYKRRRVDPDDEYWYSYFYTVSHSNASFRPKLIITYEENNQPPTTPGAFTSPTAGARWYGTHTISWGASTDPDGDPITYEVEYFNGTSWKTIGTNISGTSYSYNFANEPATSSAKLRVRAKDNRGAYSGYQESSTFTINKAPGAPTILEPKNGETVFNDRAIKWTAASDPNGDQLTYQIQLSTDNGTIWKDIGTATGTSFTYNFNVEDSSGAARIRVRAYDGQLYGPWAVSEAFIINGAPRITLITPLDNGINYSAPQEFKWEIRDTDNDMVKSRLYVDDSPVYETGMEDAGIKTATVDLSGAYEGAHTWYVEAIDVKGAIVRSEVRTLIVQKPLHEPNVLYLPRGEIPPGEFVRDLGENRKMYRKVEQTPDGEVGWLYIVEFYDPPQGVGDLKIAP